MSEEKASIDEAFLERLLKLYPYLTIVPEDAPDGIDSLLPRPPPIDWTEAGNVFPIDGIDGPSPEEKLSEDVEVDRVNQRRPKEEDPTWEDWALCIGAEIMAELRAEVWKRLHYTCSAVGYNVSSDR